jgi:Flp pilus assembly protein TadG
MRPAIKVKSAEKGQALVLIVLAVVGLFAFAALALDGGMLLSERRRAQNAADAGVMAAALAKIQGNDLFIIALQRAASNGYGTIISVCSPDGVDCLLGNGERWTVEVSNPPRSGNFAGNINYVQVSITSQVKTAFAHLVFSGPLQTTVEAVSRVWSKQILAAGNALYAATEHDCKGIWFTGTGDTLISGGDVFSNSDASEKNCNSGVQDGAGEVTVADGEIRVVGSFDQGGSGTVEPGPIEGVVPDNLRTIPTPDCTELEDKGALHVNAGEEVFLLPGRYESITFSTPNSKVVLTPGMYCIYGENGFSGNGGKVSVNASVDGVSGVMIYLLRGPFDLGGNTYVDLRAEMGEGNLVDPSGNDWKGMLVYLDPENNSEVEITGTSNSTYSGTIFAPSSDCVIQGTGNSIGLNSQVICYTVKITGTASVNITYDGNSVFEVPAAIDLVE